MTSPDDVEIELGSKVMDEDAEKLRDVDITVVARRGSGDREAFSGIEVKDHNRPLDVVHVEQLCSKLLSMPALSSRGIVSASGYTEAARRKATKLGVGLFNLQPLDAPVDLFNNAQFGLDLKFTERILMWAELPKVLFNPHQPLGDEVVRLLSDASPVFGTNGGSHGDCPNLGTLFNRVLDGCLESLKGQPEFQELGAGARKAASLLIGLSDRPYIVAEGRRLELSLAEVVGDVVWVDTTHQPTLKVLARDSDNKPYVACALAEMSQGSLVGVTISDTDPNPHLIRISVSDRNRNTILRQRLR